MRDISVPHGQYASGKSRIVTYETLRNESLYNKFVGVLMRFVAPLM